MHRTARVWLCRLFIDRVSLRAFAGRGRCPPERRAESKAEIAKAVEEFLNKDVLAQAGADIQAGPGIAPDPELKVREALDRAAAKIGERLADRPIVEASVRETIGEAYFRLGLYPKALEHLERIDLSAAASSARTTPTPWKL